MKLRLALLSALAAVFCIAQAEDKPKTDSKTCCSMDKEKKFLSSHITKI